MSLSGGRRIKRSIYLDIASVRFLTAEEVDRFERFDLLRDYIRDKRTAVARHNENAADPAIQANVRQLTNIGTFRAYIEAYLRQNEQIHPHMTLLVRQLAPAPEGLPIEIYCFTRDTAWGRYEAIQADIFDHMFAILPEFGLRAFQWPAGHDVKPPAG
jgi:miniconductance mechanosensitive channel